MVLHFIPYRSYTYHVRVVTKYIFGTGVNDIVFLLQIPIFHCQVHKQASEFCILTLYLATLL